MKWKGEKGLMGGPSQLRHRKSFYSFLPFRFLLSDTERWGQTWARKNFLLYSLDFFAVFRAVYLSLYSAIFQHLVNSLINIHNGVIIRIIGVCAGV